MDIKEKCFEYAKANLNKGVREIKTELTSFVLSNAEISLRKDQYFFGDVFSENLTNSALGLLWEIEHQKVIYNGEINEYLNGNDTFCFGGGNDFNHTAPNYEFLLKNGLFGIYKIASQKPQTAFYNQVKNHYLGAFNLINRMVVLAKEEKILDKDMISSLSALLIDKPKTLYQALQTLIIYFILQQKVDNNPPRTIGRLDKLLYPFYKKEQKERAEFLIYKFLERLAEFKVTANVPYAIGDSANELSYIILEQHIKLNSPDVKLHFLYSQSTPKNLVEIAIKGIIDGSNSIVFLNDNLIKQSLINLGIEKEDAFSYNVVGCYEPSAKEEMPCSCASFINLAKALEITINGGVDPTTCKLIVKDIPTDFNDFESFYSYLKKVLSFFAQGAIAIVTSEEKSWKNLNTGAYLSSTFSYSMEHGKDVYNDYGAKYNNTSINAQGLASLVDGIYAIKHLVFDSNLYSLNQINAILKNNWEGNENLLSIIKNLPKYGQNNNEVDIYAVEIISLLSNQINGKKNIKGGVFRLGVFSIDNRILLGKHTGATIDGRKAFSPLSKNLCASLGADKKGITSHLLSASKINGLDIPNGAVLDLVLHYSAVRGENGIENLLATLNTFIKKGGFAVHYNVFNHEILMEAKLHPEKHPNLQVRRCGWNALFNSLPEVEKDEFIFNSKLNA